MSIQHGLILHPEFDSVFWLLACDIIPPLLGHQTPIRLDHHQGWNSTDSILLIQRVGEIRVELDSNLAPTGECEVDYHLEMVLFLFCHIQHARAEKVLILLPF